MLMSCSQLGIPEQVEEIEWLSFSPVEEHFYQRQQDKCLQDAQRVQRHTHTNALLCVSTCVVYSYSSMHCGVQWVVAQLFTGSPTPQLLDYFAVDEDATIANLQQYAVNQVWTLCVCVCVSYTRTYHSTHGNACVQFYWCCCVDLDSFAEAETSMPAPPCCPRRHCFHEEDVSTVPWGRGEGI